MKRLLLFCSIFCISNLLFSQISQSAAVRTVAGNPTLFVNGQPELPFFYALTHVSGGRWSWEEMPAHNLRQMAGVGVRLFQVDLWLQDLWKNGSTGSPTDVAAKLDLELAKKQVRGVLDACPGASVVVRLHVNAPFWWNDLHPAECVVYLDGPTEPGPQNLPFNLEDGDVFYRARRASLASELWKKESGERVAEFCSRFSKTKEGRSVIGIHVAGGVYGEWHPFSFLFNEPDGGAAMTLAFRNWLVKKYGTDQNLQTAWNSTTYKIETATVPDISERKCCADGFFRDPISDRRVMDFYQCLNESTADAAEHFCKIVKKNWPRPVLTGVFFGYFHFTLCRQAMSGHLEAGRLLDSPWIDYFAGPPSYTAASREVGGSGMQRGLVRSVQKHGKMWFDEIDNGYLQNKNEVDFVRSKPLGDTTYLAVFQRSMWLSLIQNCGLWLYDFGPHRHAGWWDSPLYRAEIKRTLAYFREKYQAQLPHQQSTNASLVVWDTHSFYGVDCTLTETCDLGIDAAAEDLMRCGATVHQIYLADLQRADLKNYRTVVFMNAWQLDLPTRKFILDSVQKAGRTVVWNFNSGYSDGEKTGKELIEKLTGFSLFDEWERPILENRTGEKSIFLLGDTTLIRWRFHDFKFENVEKVQPLFLVNDGESEPLGFLTEMGGVVVARKKFLDYQSVISAVPLHGRAVFQNILKDAGCHIWSEDGGFVFVAGGHLLFHTAKPGKKKLKLANGKTVEIEFSKPGTCLFSFQNDGELFLTFP